MAKDKLSDYDGVTAGNNTDIGGISIDEGMLPSTVNNSLRELTKQLGAFADGTDGIDVLNLHDDDASASIKIQAPATVTTTTTLTLPDGAGSNGEVLTTNGSGTLSWSTAGGISDIVQDTTPQLGGNLDTNGNDITFGDNDKAIFGAGSDLQIYHNGSHSYIIDNGTGNLRLKAQNFQVLGNADDEAQIEAYQNDGVYLYFNGNQKLATTSTGIDVTGTITFDGGTTSADLNFGDNDKAIFGAGSDLQIFHNGTHSYIQDTGTGRLYITTNGDEIRLTPQSGGENGLRVQQDGAVNLYYDNGEKLATTSGGIDVTGSVTADGLTVDSDNATATIKAFQPKFILDDDSAIGAGSDKLIIQSVSGQSDGDYEFVLNNDQTLSTDQTAIKIKGNGDVSLYADDGTTQGLFWDASTQRLGLGNTSPTTTLDVTGTVTADGLTVSGATEFQDNPVISNGSPELTFETTSASHSNWQIAAQESVSQAFEISSGQNDADASDDTWTKRFVVKNDGDISFYDSTGVSQGLVWDASTQRLGLGTTAPGNKLSIANNNYIAWKNNAGSSETIAIRANTSDGLEFLTGTTRMTITSGGNVGIGTASPVSGYKLEIENSTGNAQQLITAGTNYNSTISFGDQTANTSGQIVYAHNGDYMRFDTNGSEAMRLDSSGNFMVGKSAISSGTAGFEARSDGLGIFTRSGNRPLNVHRLTNEGDLILFSQSGSNVGTISTATKATDTNIFIGSTDVNLYFFDDVDAITPCGSSGSDRDAIISLGRDSVRFKDLYLSGKTYISDGGAGAPAYTFGNDTDTGIFRPTGNQIGFTTGGTEAMRITSSQKTLFGLTAHAWSGDMRLEAKGLKGAAFTSTGGSSFEVLGLWNQATSGTRIQAYFADGSSGTVRGSITTDGTGTTYNTTSDIRLKTDIAPIADATDKLMSMNAVSHKWKAEPDADAVVGFIAQEMAEIVPEAVSKGDSEDDMWSMDYGRITPVLVAALQDAHKKIEQLEQRIADMEAK